MKKTLKIVDELGRVKEFLYPSLAEIEEALEELRLGKCGQVIVFDEVRKEFPILHLANLKSRETKVETIEISYVRDSTILSANCDSPLAFKHSD